MKPAAGSVMEVRRPDLDCKPWWWHTGCNGVSVSSPTIEPLSSKAAARSAASDGLEPDVEASTEAMKRRFELGDFEPTKKTLEVERAFDAIEAGGGDRLSVMRARGDHLTRLARGGGSGVSAPSIAPGDAVAPATAIPIEKDTVQ